MTDRPDPSGEEDCRNCGSTNASTNRQCWACWWPFHRLPPPATTEQPEPEKAKLAREIHRYIGDGKCSTKVQCQTCLGIARILADHGAVASPEPDEACFFCCGDFQSMCLHSRQRCALCVWRHTPCPHDSEVDGLSKGECTRCLREFAQEIRRTAEKS